MGKVDLPDYKCNTNIIDQIIDWTQSVTWSIESSLAA
jgi:hypothetical protein